MGQRDAYTNFPLSVVYFSPSECFKTFLIPVFFVTCGSFLGAGICTGPKREFFACFCKDVIDPKRGLFALADDAQYR